MATIEFKGIDEYSKKLAQIGLKAEAACKFAIYDAAGIVRDEIKAATPVSDDERSSGDLKDSVKLTEMQNDDGFIYTKVVFTGYDGKGAPNQLIARALESGRSSKKIGKHPFVRKATNRARKRAEQLMDFNLNKYLYEIMRK